MIKPLGLEEIFPAPPIPGPVAARTVAQLTDPLKRRLVWFLQWESHQDGGLKKFAYDLLWSHGRRHLGSPTMHRLGFDAHTYFAGADFEAICDELNHHPLSSLQQLQARLESGGGFTLDDLIPTSEETPADRARSIEREIAWAKARYEIEQKMRSENRRMSAATFLYQCREMAKHLALQLAGLCKSASAAWKLSYFQNLTGALEDTLKRQDELAKQIAAETEIATIVEDALNFAHRTRTLVLIKGTERLGKTKAAQRWAFAHPDKARLVNLTADTTNALFYGEIFDALGCGEKKTGSAGELRRAIKETVQNRDVALVFDEAHCLFGLSEKASIKRLEYIRTEFVNRGIPVVLIITPQFAHRLRQLEENTKFNVNQFRGRVARWVELPTRPNRSDIECLCKFWLPDVPEAIHQLLTNFALESEYPFSAVENAITETRELISKSNGVPLDEALIKRAIGFALFTSSQVAVTLPLPAPKPRRGRRCPTMPQPASAPALQDDGKGDARRLQAPDTIVAQPDFSEASTSSDRAQTALTY